MCVAAGITTNKESPLDGGRDIRPAGTPEEARAYLYGLIVAWGDAHGLPSDAEYAARLDAACPPSGERGRPAGMSVERLRLAETARAWRAAGHPESTVAIVLLWRSEEPPSGHLLKRYRGRLKSLERDLRELEAAEGRTSPPRPERDEGARRAASAACAARDKAGQEANRCLKEAHREERSGDDDPAYLLARAEHLRRTVKARNALDLAGIPRVRGPRDAAERREMRALARREERRAARLQRESKTEGLSSSDLTAMPRRQYEERLAEYDLEPLIEPTGSLGDDALTAWEAQRAREQRLGGDPVPPA